ncbi:type VI secretion system Vgr family protein [Dyella acidiphila]|uniref:Type VI secretion system tip protein VgrG n=1 Tax=Dyella acidiphila TaxID=2775866 RepID=A0ABR9GAK3_9GAMM|nr:type VI secretion system Vgr family protein [Dyella acidiphila]MBE1161088.1 type VI secretion system tip protein VgrG [Dyella acidiphila]
MDIPQTLGSAVASLATFTDATRLYAIDGDGPLSSLQVERWSGSEALSACYAWTIDALSTDANLSLDDMLGQRAALRTTLADGSSAVRSGLICEAQAQGSEGGMARYRLVLVPWLWLLGQGRHSRIFQDQSVLDIAASVFGDYSDFASWKITPDARSLIAQVRPRSYAVQYRETDLAFVERLLAEEGLGYSFIEDSSAPAGHTLVIFGDSGQLPEDASSAADASGAGLRYHRSSATEASDTLQALGPSLQLAPDAVTLLSYDYAAVSAVSASTPIDGAQGQREAYDPVGMYAFADSREAQHYAQLAAQVHEVQQQRWEGRGTVRTARTGTRFRVTQAPWEGEANAPSAFVWTRVWHAGINNLPDSVQQAVQKTLGDSTSEQGIPHGVDQALWERAKTVGYAQHFDALASDHPWRAALDDGHGLRLNPRPTAPGVQTAIVVGPEGETSPGASGPLHADSMGRIKVKFHWMDGGASCWLRMTQRYAGSGHGMQALPRIGQEVLVNFMDGDIDRPVIVGALYNGQGEAGVVPSPGASAVAPATALYTQAADFQPSAQGNLAGGNSPAWHGLSADPSGHGNAAALSGLKTQGFDGDGYNQLVMDDTDQQGRLQFATSHAATQLNLGNLVHQADNYRGSFRGRGMELRTDSYGAVRGGSGVLLSTYAASGNEPAGDAVAASALLKQQSQLSKALSQAATTHTTVPLSTHEGVMQANASQLNPQAAPLDAMQKSVGSVVSSDNFQTAEPAQGAGKDGDVPHSADALLTMAGRGGIGAIAGQSLHMVAGETLAMGSGQDTNLAVANQLRIHGGQAIGWLAGAQKADGVGLNLVAGKGALNMQAQHDALALRSKGDLSVVSANAAVEMQAKQTVHLAVSGGAHVTISGGNIVFGCPGKITVHAANHQFVGPTQLSREMNNWDEAQFDERVRLTQRDGKTAAANYRYEYVRADGAKIQGVTDGDGWASMQKGLGMEPLSIRLLGKA